uniref:Protein kinase domain-containing protein n=1 Tax=viral metagenome TaxID=1070528 RepID=A0A6C0EJT0_9ZZZZ
MSCKVIISAEKIHQSYCIVADDLEWISDDLYKLPGVDIYVDDVSRAVFKNTKAKAFVAIKKNVLIRGKELYSLRPLGKELYEKYERKEITDKDIDKRYSPTEELAEGAYGLVEYYPEENVVVKTIENGDIPQDMVKEIAIYNFLWKIACLPKMYGFSTKNRKLIFERGIRTLADIPPRTIPLKTQKEIMFRLAKCMRSISSQGIIHCDLKPPNIIVMDDGEIQVIDWGLSEIDRTEGQILKKNTSIQTIRYMAPEILVANIYDLGPIQYDSGVDVFSLGLVFSEINTGEAIQGDSFLQQAKGLMVFLADIPKKSIDTRSKIEEKFKQLVEGRPMYDIIRHNLMKDFIKDELLADLIARMLEFNPENRISYDQIIIHPIFQNIHRKNVPRMKKFLNNMPIIPDISVVWNQSNAREEEKESPTPQRPIPAHRRQNPRSWAREDKPISFRVRKILFDWVYDTVRKFGTVRILCLSLQLIDLYIVKRGSVMMRKDLQRYCCAIIYLSSCLMMEFPLEFGDIIYASSNSITSYGLFNAINDVLKTLNGNILIATLWDYTVSRGMKIDSKMLLEQYLKNDIYAQHF